MKNLLKRDSIIILLGTGGVGKTTIAAALALAAAQNGLETGVITVDPAQRLRDALGIARLGGNPLRLSKRQLEAAGLAGDLHLSAMLLDVKGGWDSIIERVVPDQAARERILKNPFYQSLSAEFAGADAFAALQQLYDLHASGAFELQVVDTPPAAHAFDFLEAPARYIRLLDSRAARWLFNPSLSAGRFAIKLASQTAKFVVRELERFAGGRLLATIGDFFAATSEGVDAIVDQLRKAEALMRSRAVKFILVTTPEQDRLERARELMNDMQAGGFALSAVIINRFLDERLWAEPGSGGILNMDGLAKAGAPRELSGNGASLSGGLVQFLTEYRQRTLEEIERVVKFAHDLPENVKLGLAPEIQIGVRDLGALARVAGFVTSGVAPLRKLEVASRASRAARLLSGAARM